MNFNGIAMYLSRALIFAFFISLLWFIVHRKEKNETKVFLLKLLFVFYMATLIQITVIRDWQRFFLFTPSSITTLQLIPFGTTLEVFQKSTWDFLYNIGGNILWFIPFGLLLPSYIRIHSTKQIVFYSFLLSLSIEFSQFLVSSGISDIDDIIYNVLGGTLGYLLFTITKKYTNIL